jgi:hypothetical protein
LKDLVDSGMVYRTGVGDLVQYRLADSLADRLGDADAPAAEQRLDTLVWVAVHRLANATLPELQNTLSLTQERIEPSLARLVRDGRVRAVPASEGDSATETRYTSDGCVLPLGEPLGWEAALFDHYQAVVAALCAKLRSGKTRARHNDWIGGSTYSFDVTPEHPHFAEVTGFLAEFRTRGSELRQRVADYNRNHPTSEGAVLRVIHYAGQNVLGGSELEEQYP